MSEAKPIPVRLDEDLIRRLDAVAAKSGIGKRSAVIKFCVSSFLDYFERNGSAVLPVNWREILGDMDGRAKRYGKDQKKSRTS